MRCTSRQRGTRLRRCGAWRHAVGSFPGLTVLCALAAALLLVAPAVAQTAGDKLSIRVAGPLAAREMTEALAREFSKTKPTAALDYLRNDAASSAAASLVSGRDMILTLGRVNEKDISYSKDRWKALAPEEHVIAARAVAIVVHERSAVESLTMEQLQLLFSGKAKDWTTFGGQAKAVRCYGLAFGDPLTTMFHDKAISAVKCGLVTRKKDSAETLTALAADPQGVAFVDAVAAMSAGDTVKIVAIGTDKTTIAPNAQTIKDGTYPLADTLVLYVSPKASQAAQDFAQFILAGKGDATFRKHGFMPTLRAASADVLAAFEKLYGPDIKRVKGTPDTADDLTLAGQMIQSARTGKLDAELLAAMCEAAYDLTANASGGQTQAFEALGVLAEKVPDKRFDCAVRRAALCERVYKDGKARADGEHLVEALMTAGELGTSSRRFAEAADAWKKALTVAEEVNSPRLAAIKERQPAFEARRQSLAEAASLAARLRSDPKDIEARMKLFWAQLVELDNPAEAAKYIDVVTAEDFKTYVPLASEPTDKLSEEAALKLAEWYVGLIDKAGPGGKELMNAKARACYVRFFDLHKNREDALAMRAALGIQKIGGKVPDPPVAPTAGGKKPQPPQPAVNAGLQPNEEITDLKLAEFVAANPNITKLTRQEIGTARQITDLRPLARLAKLTTLELHQAGNIKDISPLSKLPDLTSLTITGLEVESVSALSGLSKLTALSINDAKNVTDIAPVGRLLGLKTLNLPGCAKVSDLTPVSRLTGLTNLNLSGCEKVSDLAPLEKLAKTLTSLNLNGCKTGDVYKLSRLMKLKNLDLRNCEGVSEDDLAWLAKRLKDCRIQPAPPATSDK